MVTIIVVCFHSALILNLIYSQLYLNLPTHLLFPLNFTPSYNSTLPSGIMFLLPEEFLVFLFVQILLMTNSLFGSKCLFFLNFWRYKILDRHFEDSIPLSSSFHCSYQGWLNAVEFNVWFFSGCFRMFSLSSVFISFTTRCLRVVFFVFFPLQFKVFLDIVTCIYSWFSKILGYYLFKYC